MADEPNPDILILRHTVATLAYRASKAIRDAPPEFARFQPSPSSRTPAEILAHMGDLFDWALSLAGGAHKWHDSMPLAWDDEAARFFAALESFDRRLALREPLSFPATKLFQGPIADALTHVGQIALLRGMAGAPVKGENYFKADIVAGRVDAGQPRPKVEFS